MSTRHDEHLPSAPGGSEGHAPLAREAARALLDRSIDFGHRRLAVVRLAMAVHIGVNPTSAQWAFCREAAEMSRDGVLQALMRDAEASGHVMA